MIALRQTKLAFTVAILSIATVDIIVRINMYIGVSNGSTELIFGLTCIALLVILVVSRNIHFYRFFPNLGKYSLYFYFFWSILTFVRGAFAASDYWDWKNLLFTYLPSMLVPVVVLAGINIANVATLVNIFIFRLFLFGFLIIPIALVHDSEMFARVVLPVGMLLLYLPYLSVKARLILISISIVSLLFDLTYRTNILRLIFPLFIGLLFYFSGTIRRFILNVMLFIFFITPLILLILGLTGSFNFFQDSFLQYMQGQFENTGGGESRVVEFSADTRTFLYREVFSSMIYKDSSFVLGEGGGAAYLTDFFDWMTVTSKGRYGSEVGFLNILMNSGVIGVLAYLSVLVSSTYYGINRSNNKLTKMLSLFLAFQWVLLFIENPVKFDLLNVTIWFSIGICLSKEIRQLDDSQIISYMRVGNV